MPKFKLCQFESIYFIIAPENAANVSSLFDNEVDRIFTEIWDGQLL